MTPEHRCPSDATPPESVETALVEMALEERVGGASPPDLSARILAAASARNTVVQGPAARRPSLRGRLLAASLLLAGAGVVTGVALLERPDRKTLLQEPQAQEPQAQEPQSKDTQPRDPQPRVGSKDAAAFFPLQPGTRWEYEDTIDGVPRQRTVLAAVAVRVDGELIVQLAEFGGADVAFTFWSHDARGVHQQSSNGMSEDPMFAPIEHSTIELPTPVGAEAAWKVERMPNRSLPRGVQAGRRARARAADAIAGTATLLGVEEALRVGERDYHCLHVRVVSDGEGGAVEEHSWYARGVGLVRRTTSTGGTEQVRELRAFHPTEPLPDRDTILAAELRDLAKGARWLELPADSEAPWTLRSSLALVGEGPATKVYRVSGSRVVAFDPEKLEAFVDLAAFEDFGPRMHGLFPQRATHGVCVLALHLHAALRGFDVQHRFPQLIKVGPAGTDGTMTATLRGRDGGGPVRVTARMQGALPTYVAVDPPAPRVR